MREELSTIIEALIFASEQPLSVNRLAALLTDVATSDTWSKKDIRAALDALQQRYEGQGIELVEVASGYRFQIPNGFSPWVSKLFEERAPRYSRALLETLAIITYCQPITRAEIEDIRGVAVSSNIIKTLQEREWIHVIGHKETPGRPSLFGTTAQLLDYFGLKKLDELPDLADVKDFEMFAVPTPVNDSN